MDYYRILGLTETADEETVKKAYRKLAKQCHPDIYPGDKRAEERFKLITEAYAVLSDVEKRKKYDRERNGRSFAHPFSFVDSPVKNRQKSQSQTTETKKETGHNPIDTSGLFERYMGFK